MSTRRLTDVPADVLGAAQRIWFAGLGAMAFAQEEGSRLVFESGKLLSAMVEKGEEIERTLPSPAARVKGAASTAEDVWTKIQSAVDTRMSATLQRLGVPTRDELVDLTRRIEELTASVESLRAQG